MFDLHNNLDATVDERGKLLGWELPELPRAGNTHDMKQESDLCCLLIAFNELLPQSNGTLTIHDATQRSNLA